MRVALFGGTFDPIHRGHLAVAKAAKGALALDTIVFAPTGRQPLKSSGAIAPFADRLAMTKLACVGSIGYIGSDFDAPRADGTPNYTVDLLEVLAKSYPDADLYAIAGLDSFLTLPRWHDADRLLSLAEWIVVSRPGYSFDSLGSTFRGAGMTLPLAHQSRIHQLTSVHENVSATQLRERLRQGDSCSDLIPDAVSSYIVNHGLYR